MAGRPRPVKRRAVSSQRLGTAGHRAAVAAAGGCVGLRGGQTEMRGGMKMESTGGTRFVTAEAVRNGKTSCESRSTIAARHSPPDGPESPPGPEDRGEREPVGVVSGQTGIREEPLRNPNGDGPSGAVGSGLSQMTSAAA